MVRMSTMQDTRCQRPGCGRKIWAEQSERTGYGSGCRTRVHLAERLAARHEGFKPEQVAKAVQLIEDNGIVLTGVPGMFWCTSSDGTRLYVTSLVHCTCDARVACYHMVAVSILTAS
jgi:hypothetical protein